MNRQQAILKVSLFVAVCSLWVGVIVACSNDRPEREQNDRRAAPEPAKEPAPEPVREPPPPPPPAPPPTTSDGGQAQASTDGGATCTGRGQDLCPLQAFMKRTLQPAVKAGRGADELRKVAGWAPDPSWNDGPNGWRLTAEATAAAIEASDRSKVQAMCKQCHTAWQKRYRAEFRARPVPDR